MKVVEIFKSIEGEGKRAGLPATFIRFFGCNLSCSYCDSRYACISEGENSFDEMSVEEIIAVCQAYRIPSVTVTGGEPLIQKNIDKLLEALLDYGFLVNVETNGTIKPRVRHVNLFYTMDYKTKSSGEDDRMNIEVFKDLNENDVLKFVVGSLDDCMQAKKWIEEMKKVIPPIQGFPEIYFSPVFGKINPKDIVDFLLEHHMVASKVQLQLHKYIWSPEMRGV